MRKYRKKTFTEKRERYFLKQASCGWCGKEYGGEYKGYVRSGDEFELDFDLKPASKFSSRKFEFEICDDCFKKHLMPRAGKAYIQMGHAGYVQVDLDDERLELKRDTG